MDLPHRIDRSRLSAIERLKRESAGIAMKAAEHAQGLLSEASILAREIKQLESKERTAMDMKVCRDIRAQIVKLQEDHDRLSAACREARADSAAAAEIRDANGRLFGRCEEFMRRHP